MINKAEDNHFRHHDHGADGCCSAASGVDTNGGWPLFTPRTAGRLLDVQPNPTAIAGMIKSRPDAFCPCRWARFGLVVSTQATSVSRRSRGL